MQTYKNEVVFDIETTGLNPWLGDQITCICAKEIHSPKTFCVSNRSQWEIISQFLRWLRQFSPSETVLVTANGKQFDVPFICSRLSLELLSAQNLVYFAEFNPLHLLCYNHFDVLNDITDKTISLNNLCRILNIPPKDQDGKGAIKLFSENKFEELEKYCFHDVDITATAYLRYRQLKDRNWNY